ncbi:hypothetical protein YT14_002772 [Salmonella enterica subsp. enterica serovar Oslo]|nr:hypothetical protein [Salmonella enterica subsp. enterica serovar Oslo]
MKNKLSSFLRYIIFFPLLCSTLGLLGMPIGIIMAFLKTGNFNLNLKDELDVIFFTIKIGVPIGFILGLGLWIISILDKK